MFTELFKEQYLLEQMICYKCNLTKELLEFSPSQRRKWGVCRCCAAQWTRQWNKSNPEKLRNKNSAVSTIRKKAYSKVIQSLKMGRLKRKSCQHCNSTMKTHTHHKDYSKPLDVMWLCPSCHKIEHNKEKKQDTLTRQQEK